MVGCSVRHAGASFQSAHSHNVASSDAERFAFGSVESHFGFICRHCNDVAARDGHIAVSVDAVVCRSYRHDVASAYLHVLRRVDAVVVGFYVDVAVGDVERVLALYAFGVMAAGSHIYSTSADDYSTGVFVAVIFQCLQSRLDAFGRGVVAAVYAVRVAGVVCVLRSTIIII